MPNPPEYCFVLSATAFRFVSALRNVERQILGDIFQSLAEHPHLRGDYQELNAESRPREVFLRGHFLVTYWTDHAVKEVRVVRVDKL